MKAEDTFITRFAPSPNGWLHLGHAYSALIGAHEAARHGGQFLVRLEDIDVGRARPHFIDGIYQDLAWLGLSWPEPVMVQSTRFSTYAAALKKLRDKQLVYPCWATRRDIQKRLNEAYGTAANWPRDPDGAPVYPGLYRNIREDQRQTLLWEGGAYAWRLDMQKALALAATKTEALAATKSKALATQKSPSPLSYIEVNSGTPTRLELDAAAFGDVILARKDVPTSYHLAVVVDDAAQNVTQVTRGADLQPATAIHRLLQILLDLPEPVYHHHELVRDTSGRRLSKQAGDMGFRALRQQGYSREDVLALLPAPFGDAG